MKDFTRMAALGALGVVGGLGVGYALFVFWLTRPDGQGMDRIEAWVGWISVGCVVAALAAVHVVFARVLSAVAAGRKFSVERVW
jgi:hypothetical protein